jgi:hypothetical protein
MSNYSEYDTIKVKLRVTDDSLKDEIRLYMQEIDDLINNRIRAKLGSYNAYDEFIELPLTENTIPPIPLELKAIANNLVVAKVRLQNSEKPMLWDSEVKILENYLDRVYGLTNDKPFQPVRELTITPASGAVGTTVTISGIYFQPRTKLNFVFGSTILTTTPATVITDARGSFSGVTFQVPPNHPPDSYEIKVSDKKGGTLIRFQVT